MKIQTKFLILMAAILTSLSVLAWLFSQHFISRMNERWAEQMSERHVQFDRQKTLKPLIAEMALARKLAADPAVIRMALHENDANAKAEAMQVLANYQRLFTDQQFFIAFSKSNHLYSFNAGRPVDTARPPATLDQLNQNDQWLFSTLATLGDFKVRVEKTENLKSIKVLLNVAIKYGDQTIGMVGTRMDVSELLKEAVQVAQPDIHNLFLDDEATIQLYLEKNLINYAKITAEEKDLNHINLLLKKPADVAALRVLMRRLKNTDVKIGMIWVNFAGQKHLLGVGYLPELGWYDLTFMNVENLMLTGNPFALMGLLMLLFLLAIIVIGLMVHRWVLSPMTQLQRSMTEIQQGNYDVKPPMVGTGEVLQLSRSFAAMIGFVRSTNFILEDNVKQRTQSLRESEDRFRSMIEAIPDAIFLKDSQHRWLIVNEPAKRLFRLHNIAWQGRTELELAELQPEFRAAHKKCMIDDQQAWESGGLTISKETAVHGDGSLRDYEVRKMPIYDGQGRPKALLIIGRDVTDAKQAEDALRVAAIAFESLEGMIVTDAQNIILRVNQAFTQTTGYTAEEAIGRSPSFLNSGRQDQDFYLAMWESVKQTGTWSGEVWNRRKNGDIYPEHLMITAVKNNQGEVTNYVSTLTDISLRKAATEEINNLAFYDPLTNLPNRRLLYDRVNHALASSTRNGRDGAMLFLDLDHFKTLNDTLGHNMGDLLLQQVAKRLQECVRDDDTVARLGGDEFVVMLENLSEHSLEAATQAEAVGEKILVALGQPYQLESYEYQSTPSIGIALFSDHNLSQEDLLKHADIAMYQAKKSGRNTLRFFDPHMQDAINVRADLERELRKAVTLKQFALYYQIQVDAEGLPTGAEALIRWIHPVRGLVSPFDFIPLAEDTGLILPMGQWVLETACAQLKQWAQGESTKRLSISINVSAKQFRQAHFVEQVQAAIRQHEIDPHLLKLEITESTLLDHIDEIISTMNALKQIGIRFSLDDFGTGYSSLQYLKLLPLYQLKIDQSFVRDLAVDHSDKAIVLTVITMAHSLDLKVIAEGVETQDQRQFLLENGCREYQGYLFSKPLPVAQFEALLESI